MPQFVDYFLPLGHRTLRTFQLPGKRLGAGTFGEVSLVGWTKPTDEARERITQLHGCQGLGKRGSCANCKKEKKKKKREDRKNAQEGKLSKSSSLSCNSEGDDSVAERQSDGESASSTSTIEEPDALDDKGIIQVALKIVPKARVASQSTQKEIMNVLKTFDHPHVIKLFEWFETETHYYMAFEPAWGGELYDSLVEQHGGKLREDLVKNIIKDLVSGIAFIHSHYVCHRDLKLENLFLRHKSPSPDDLPKLETQDTPKAISPSAKATPSSRSEVSSTTGHIHHHHHHKPFDILIADFGACQTHFREPKPYNTFTKASTPSKSNSGSIGSGSGQASGTSTPGSGEGPKKRKSWKMNGLAAGLSSLSQDKATKESERRSMMMIVGSPGYTAPEVYKCEGYDEKVDCWSIGVITFALLAGRFPFHHSIGPNFIVEASEGVRFPPASKTWAAISEEAKDFIHKLLDFNPQTRLSAEDAEKHPWFAKETAENVSSESIPISLDASSTQPISEERKLTRKETMAKTTDRAGV